jgi:hypothetical protein
MKPNAKLSATLAALLLSGGLLAACEEEGPAERAGENIDEAAEEMGDAMDEATEDLDDGNNP